MRLTEEQVCEGGEWLEDPKSSLNLFLPSEETSGQFSENMFAVGRPPFWNHRDGQRSRCVLGSFLPTSPIATFVCVLCES